MTPELLMYECRMYALVVQLEGMKTDNAKSLCDGNPPFWTSDHFNGLQADLERLADAVAGVL